VVVDGGLTIGGRHSWDPHAASPMLEMMGFTPEQAEALRQAQAAARQAG
jgi:hypothetical protein